MDYEYSENDVELHERFCDRFVLTFDEFKAKFEDSDWIKNSPFSVDEVYESNPLWDKLRHEGEITSFEDALSLLKRRSQSVILICERDNCFDDSERIAIIADSAELAEELSFEWYTTYQLHEQNCYMENAVLPEDIYVFDETYSWYIIFTHEYPWDEDHEYYEKRLCITYGL